MNLLHLKRHEIDDDAWNASLKAASNRRIYAATWYLDLVTQEQWNALVSDDYRYLFPLPFNQKIPGLLQVQRPIICQQLGLFGEVINEEVLRRFIAAIPKKYRRINLSLNAACRLPELKERTNLELSLSDDITTIRAGYSKSLRKRIRRAEKELRVEKTTDLTQIISLYQEEVGGRLGWSKATFQDLEKLLSACLEREKVVAYLVYNLADELVAGGCFLLDTDRIINVLGAANAKGRQQFATHFLLDKVIDIHQPTVSIFDFEGSDLAGVSDFFRSYGATRVPYYELERDTFPLAVKWILKLKGLQPYSTFRVLK